jgi:ATP-binding protein involved in chromosome partitioning
LEFSLCPNTFSGLSSGMLTKESVTNALKGIKYPGYSRDILSFGLLKNIAIHEGEVTVSMQLSTPNLEIAQQIKREAELALRNLPEAHKVQVDVLQPNPSQAGPASPWSGQAKIPGVKRIVAIASGKGGVGKSTVSVNLACALNHLGAKIGLLDCDIYGPSIPLMMGINQRPTVSEAEFLVPPSNHGIKVMSMGLLLDGDSPVIWRGPMITKTIQQFLFSVEWGDLDYLLVDLPPGTGDAQLSLCQTVPLDGGVIVTTPQEASVGVVRKGMAMFEKVNVPILGIIENMTYFTTPNGERIEIFGHGGGRNEANRRNVRFLGEIPIFQEIRIGGDAGVPVTVSAPSGAPAKAFIEVGAELKRILPC